MNVLQIVATGSNECGITLFAKTLETQARRVGINVTTLESIPPDAPADLLLLQYHDELFSDGDAAALLASRPVPVVVFSHSEGSHEFFHFADGFITMCADMVASVDRPVHVFPHPAWTPEHLEDRVALRKEFGLPEDRLVVGTNGFLKFERQFVEILDVLLPKARQNDWLVQLVTSPWRLESPGLVARLRLLEETYARHFRFQHIFLDTQQLNRRLQACDLLWCWTAAPSSKYASGVVTDQYASGTRVIAASKEQHAHVLKLPNAVAGPDELTPFAERVIAELAGGRLTRHDPRPVSWENYIGDLGAFLKSIAARRQEP